MPTEAESKRAVRTAHQRDKLAKRLGYYEELVTRLRLQLGLSEAYARQKKLWWLPWRLAAGVALVIALGMLALWAVWWRFPRWQADASPAASPRLSV